MFRLTIKLSCRFMTIYRDWLWRRCLSTINGSPNREGLSVDITALAQEVFDILNAPANPVPRSPEKQKKKKSQFFINSSNKKAKSVTLHIQGLDSTVSRLTDTETLIYIRSSKLTNTFPPLKVQRGLCEEALLKVRGVISFTFQMASKRCTVRIRSDLPTEVRHKGRRLRPCLASEHAIMLKSSVSWRNE